MPHLGKAWGCAFEYSGWVGSRAESIVIGGGGGGGDIRCRAEEGGGSEASCHCARNARSTDVDPS